MARDRAITVLKGDRRGASGKKQGGKLPKWDLRDLYRDLDDPAIERDLRAAERAAREFNRSYRGKLGRVLPNSTALAAVLTEYERIHELLGIPSSYAYLRYAEAPADEARGAFLQKVNARSVSISQELLFLELELAALPEKKLLRMANAPVMKRLRHYVERVLVYKPHRLSEAEERLIDERNLTGRAAFNRLFDQEHAELRYSVKVKGTIEVLSGTQTLELLQRPDRTLRRAAADGLTAGLKSRARLNTFVFNTLYEDKRIEDKYRRFAEPETARHLSNEMTAAMVETMADVVRESYPLVQRYYRLKSRALGIKPLADYDRYAPIGKVKGRSFSYAEARDIVLIAFERFAPGYRRLAEQFFTRNWIDAAVRPGKRGGAFCHPVTPSKHPYVFTNFSGSLRDVLTLAHELGHAIHFVLMAPQGYLNADVPLTIAETASVFSEMLVFDHLKQELDEGELFSLLAGKVENIFSTVHRQIAMYTFEQELHRARRQGGEVPTEQINALWRRTQSAMFGTSVTLSPGYDYWWSYIPHFIHSPFYVYAYAFGELLTLALYEQYIRGRPGFVERYLDMLGAGASAAPHAIVKPLGLDLKKRAFWKGGIEVVTRMVGELESLARRNRSLLG